MGVLGVLHQDAVLIEKRFLNEVVHDSEAVGFRNVIPVDQVVRINMGEGTA